MLWVVTVAWLYIKPFRNVSSKEPTGDPVDSDPDVLAAEAALSEPTVWSQKGFATPVKLWPFSPILPVLEKYIFTLLNGAIEKFCDLKGIFLVGQVPLFFEKKKILLKSVLQFTQVCPCVGLRKCAPAWKEKFFFLLFFWKLLVLLLYEHKKEKNQKKKSRSYGLRKCAPALVYASVPLRENWNCLFFCFTCRKKERAKKNIFFTRCGLSSTYHLVPLTLLQYDTKPTRQCDSIMLIHDSLDTGVFKYHPSTILADFYVPPGSCESAAASFTLGLLGAHPLSQCRDR